MKIREFDVQVIYKEWKDSDLEGEIITKNFITVLKGIRVARKKAENLLIDGIWSRKIRNEEVGDFSIAKHIESSNGVSGYVSTTENLLIAKEYAGESGFIFCMTPELAIQVKGNPLVDVIEEYELIVPEGISPENIHGFRKCEDGIFVGPIYTRSNIVSAAAHSKLIRWLSDGSSVPTICSLKD
ncbi:hypothetical protein [Piscirickettsia litoralis]|uniref:Uncharacterized protein n=1 Tax=Piscirickettsia litoralis TaxID=1891921 RepID=A0ABX2ZZK1_9GAMM|nr:hypothetical protein [Piscirickettsia litoralis]ODN41452.1 hypothetical protein BGC07_15125 [Piscirickettsia litoralis]